MNEYFLIFIAGLLGSVHCVAMCGGLISACAVRFGGGAGFSVKYNSGRVLTYTVLGLVMGLVGSTLSGLGALGGLQGLVPVAAGAFMVVIGLDLLGIAPKALRGFTAGRFPGFLSKAVKGRKPPAFVLGMMNGLVPCGLLYAVGVKAAAAADPVSGMLVMASLGAGTFVPMLFTGTVAGLAGRAREGLFTTASSVVIIALGVKSIIHGAGHIEMMF